MPTLGGLQGDDVRVTHRPRQVPRCTASKSGRDLVVDACEVCFGGDRGRSQGGLRAKATLQGVENSD